MHLHVKTVTRFNGKVPGTVAQYSTAFTRGPQGYRFRPVELCVVPVHLAKRQDLPCEKSLSLLGAFAAKPQRNRQVLAGIGFEELNASSRIQNHFLVIK